MSEHILRAYADVWSEPDPQRRAELLDICWTETSEIIGPGFRLCGRQAVLDDAARVQRDPRGLRAVLASGFDVHSGWARFAFHVVDPQGTVVDEGWDLVELAADGRIARVISFFGPLPALAAQDRGDA